MNSEGKQTGIMVVRPYEAHWYIGHDHDTPEPNAEPPLPFTLYECIWDFVGSIGIPKFRKLRKRQHIDD